MRSQNNYSREETDLVEEVEPNWNGSEQTERLDRRRQRVLVANALLGIVTKILFQNIKRNEFMGTGALKLSYQNRWRRSVRLE